MKSSFVATGLILTCVVVHTCIRIEVLNARYGYYLPRNDLDRNNPEWRVAALSIVRKSADRMIALERQSEFLQQHPDQPVPDEAAFRGPPYSKAEQEAIDSDVQRSKSNSDLYYSVRGMGLLQYLLAPAALAWSVDLARIRAPRWIRITGIAGCVLNAICIALMLYRGYFQSLGW
jgi:hypothetical protein